MSSAAMSDAAESFVNGKYFSDRLAKAKEQLIGREIVDVIWEQYHDDEIVAMLILDNGETVRGPALGEYAEGTGFE